MNILHVAPAYLPATCYGGPIYSVHGLCKALAARGHEVSVYTTNANGRGVLRVPTGEPQAIDGVKVVYYPIPVLGGMFYSPRLAKDMEKHIHSFDLVHVHGTYSWPAYAASKCARKCRVPYLISTRGMLVRSLIRKKSRLAKELWIRLLERRNFKEASMFHATSEREKMNLLEMGFPESKIAVVPNGCDFPKREEGPMGRVSKIVSDAASKGRYILYVGRIDWMKGIERLIHALSLTSGTRLIIAGGDERGYRKRMEALVSSLKLNDRVDFVGHVQGRDKDYLYESAQLLALLSDHENFGNSVIEAMMHRRPVLVTPGVGASSYVKESGAGKITSDNPKVIAKDIGEMLSDENSLKVAGEKGFVCASKELSWESIALKMTKIYEEILASRAGGATP